MEENRFKEEKLKVVYVSVIPIVEDIITINEIKEKRKVFEVII